MQKMLLIFFYVMIFPTVAHAYIGPGLGLGVIGVVLGIIVSVLLAVVGIFWYPLKRIIKKLDTSTQKNQRSYPRLNKLYDKTISFVVFASIFMVGIIFHENILMNLEDFKSKWDVSYGELLTINDVSVWVDQEDKIHDELILVSPMSRGSVKPSIYLVNNKGMVLHQWTADLSAIEQASNTDDFITANIKAYPLSEGRLLTLSRFVSSHGNEPSVIQLLDANSNIIWSNIGVYHHDFDITKDGRIVILTNEAITPDKDNYIVSVENSDNIKYLDEVIEYINLEDGKRLDSFSLTDLMIHSPYKEYIVKSLGIEDIGAVAGEIDLYHSNSVDYIEADQTDLWPLLQEGDILITMLTPDLLSVLRPNEKKIIWSKKGPWYRLHHARLTDEGTISLFDNGGEYIISNSMLKTTYSRMLDYNPQTDSAEVIYRNEIEYPIRTPTRSFFYKRDNYSLIASYEQARLLQVDNEGKVVWDMRLGANRGEDYGGKKSKLAVIQSFERTLFSPEFLESITK